MVRTRRKKKIVWQGPYARVVVVFAAILVVLTAAYFITTAIMRNDTESTTEETAVAAATTQTAAIPTTTEDLPPVETTTPDDQTTVPTATPTPDPTPEPDNGPTPPTLTEGKTYTEEDSGEEVQSIQQMLVDLGFDPGEPDGIYGSMLEDAIDNFQLYAGLTADGIAGPNTISTLADKWVDAMTELEYDDQPLAGVRIGIDAGHQRHANSDPEPVAPGSSTTKGKVSSGTYGRFTGVPEYVINLQVALRLKRELEALGADVIMTREVHGVNISNAQRADDDERRGCRLLAAHSRERQVTTRASTVCSYSYRNRAQ